MNIMLAPGQPVAAQPIVGAGSRVIYRPQSGLVVTSVADEDVALLESMGYVLLGETEDSVTSITAGTGATVDQPTGDVTVGVSPPAHALVAGAAAGDVAVAGIALGDRLDSVIEYVYTAGVTTDVLDLTAEFAITADGTINNTGGSDTTGNKLLVNWTALV